MRRDGEGCRRGSQGEGACVGEAAACGARHPSGDPPAALLHPPAASRAHCCAGAAATPTPARSQSKSSRVRAERQPASITPGLMSPLWMRRRREANSRKKMTKGKISREMSRASHLQGRREGRAGRRARIRRLLPLPAEPRGTVRGSNRCFPRSLPAPPAAAELTCPRQTASQSPSRRCWSGSTAGGRAGGGGRGAAAGKRGLAPAACKQA